MTSTKSLEYRITQKMVASTWPGNKPGARSRAAELTIKVLSATVVVTLLGVQFPELVWASLGASVVYVLGTG